MLSTRFGWLRELHRTVPSDEGTVDDSGTNVLIDCFCLRMEQSDEGTVNVALE